MENFNNKSVQDIGTMIPRLFWKLYHSTFVTFHSQADVLILLLHSILLDAGFEYYDYQNISQNIKSTNNESIESLSPPLCRNNSSLPKDFDLDSSISYPNISINPQLRTFANNIVKLKDNSVANIILPPNWNSLTNDSTYKLFYKHIKKNIKSHEELEQDVIYHIDAQVIDNILDFSLSNNNDSLTKLKLKFPMDKIFSKKFAENFQGRAMKSELSNDIDLSKISASDEIFNLEYTGKEFEVLHSTIAEMNMKHFVDPRKLNFLVDNKSTILGRAWEEVPNIDINLKNPTPIGDFRPDGNLIGPNHPGFGITGIPKRGYRGPSFDPINPINFLGEPNPDHLLPPNYHNVNTLHRKFDDRYGSGFGGGFGGPII